MRKLACSSGQKPLSSFAEVAMSPPSSTPVITNFIPSGLWHEFISRVRDSSSEFLRLCTITSTCNHPENSRGEIFERSRLYGERHRRISTNANMDSVMLFFKNLKHSKREKLTRRMRCDPAVASPFHGLHSTIRNRSKNTKSVRVIREIEQSEMIVTLGLWLRHEAPRD